MFSVWLKKSIINAYVLSVIGKNFGVGECIRFQYGPVCVRFEEGQGVIDIQGFRTTLKVVTEFLNCLSI